MGGNVVAEGQARSYRIPIADENVRTQASEPNREDLRHALPIGEPSFDERSTRVIALRASYDLLATRRHRNCRLRRHGSVRACRALRLWLRSLSTAAPTSACGTTKGVPCNVLPRG